MREGAFGQTAYRVRERTDRMPGVRMLRSTQLTQLIMAANIAVFVMMLLTGRPQDSDILVRFGALTRPLPEGEWWRLFSSMFVHVGLFHILFNMWALISFGPAVENRYGKLRFIGLYLGSGLLGAAASLAFNQGIGVAAGASGAVFGILGSWIAYFTRHRNVPGAREQLQSLLFLVGINLVFGLVGPIDNMAHLGGLAGGFAIGSLLEAGARMRGNAPALVAMAAFLAVAAISAALVIPRTCAPGGLADIGGGRRVPCTAIQRLIR